MARFKPFNHYQIFSLVFSAMLVFTLFSSAWAKKDHDENPHGPRINARVIDVPGVIVPVPVPDITNKKNKSHKNGPGPSPGHVEKIHPQGQKQPHKWANKDHDRNPNGPPRINARVIDVPGIRVPVPVPGITIKKDRSYKNGPGHSREHMDNRYPPPQYRPHNNREYYSKKNWKHWDREYGRSPWEYRHRPRYGSRHHALPTNYFSMFIGGVPFFYSAGVYFQSDSQGYVVVQPPLGGRVQILPEGCSSFYYGDRRCYSCDDVFYEEMGSDYVVINRPSSYRIIADAGDEVEIDAETLNLRTGPGLRYDTLTILQQGEIVAVEAIEGDWYYVSLEDGNYGWIKREYTRIIRLNEEPKG